MIKAHTLALAAAVTAGAAVISVPAMAAYVQLGQVDVGYRVDRSATWNRFGGRMEGLRLRADGSDIYCRSIKVQYGNGRTGNVYSGALREDRPVYVDLAGGSRIVRRVDFVCRSAERQGARIRIMADVGRYQDEWRRSPDWATMWSRLFNFAPGPGRIAGPGPGARPAAPVVPNVEWIELTRLDFQGRNDRARSFAGWGGRSVDRIALEPRGNDARCARATVVFGDGSRQNLDVARYSRLEQGQQYRFDLAGNIRGIRSLDLVCHAIGGNNVTIEILVRKSN